VLHRMQSEVAAASHALSPPVEAIIGADPLSALLTHSGSHSGRDLAMAGGKEPEYPDDDLIQEDLEEGTAGVEEAAPMGGAGSVLPPREGGMDPADFEEEVPLLCPLLYPFWTPPLQIRVPP